MSRPDWLSNRLRLSLTPASRGKSRAARMSFRPGLQRLEDRKVLSTYTAATTVDLIADIAAANKAGGTNTITLTANTTFVLTAVNNTTKGLGPNGLPIVGGSKADNLSIVGNGDVIERSTNAGTSVFRFFQVAKGSSLTLQNVELQNGLLQGTGSAAASGGAIYNLGTLTLSGSTLSGNVAGGYGGGIDNEGTLTVIGSSLSNNSAGYSGGGMVNDGVLTVTNSTLLSNIGDGLQNSGSATLTDSMLSYNSSCAGGGGIVNFGGGTMTISGCTLSYNTAVTDGGGILDTGTLMINGGSTIAYNTAGSVGGGIFGDGRVTLTFSESSLLGNSAGDGGGVFTEGGMTLLLNGGSNVSGNTAGGDGGGIEVYSGTATISDSTVSDNSAGAEGGGIDITKYASVTVTLCSFSANSPDSIFGVYTDGGGNSFN